MNNGRHDNHVIRMTTRKLEDMKTKMDNHAESPVLSMHPPGYLALRTFAHGQDWLPPRTGLWFRREPVLQRACPGTYMGNMVEKSYSQECSIKQASSTRHDQSVITENTFYSRYLEDVKLPKAEPSRICSCESVPPIN